MAQSNTGGAAPLKPVTVENVAATIAREVKALHGVELFKAEELAAKGGTIAILPEGKRVEDLKPILDRYLTKPARRRGTATLTDAAWSGKNGASMTQVDFAAFIEENITDVIVPNLDDPNLKTFAELVQGRFATPSDLLAMSRGLAINVETTVKNAVQLNSGIINVQFEETHRDGLGQPIQIANLFQICVPVFYGGIPYRIAVRLRYRQAGGKIVWSYQLVRPDIVFDDAFKGIVKLVVDETEVPVFLGAPEA